MQNIVYDVVICGAGPAGMTAAIYADRAGLKTALIEKGAFGGQVNLTSGVENYPGFKSIEGYELCMKMQEQVSALGVDVIYSEVTAFELAGRTKKIVTASGEVKGRNVILAMGAYSRLLDVPGEAEFTGRGVSYCAVCDGAFFRGKTVVVVGGGNAAVEDALYLSRMCEKVYLLHRRDTLRAEPYEAKKVAAEPKIVPVWDSVVIGIDGTDGKVAGCRVKNVKTGAETAIAASGVFVAIGRVPHSELLKDTAVKTDESGYIKVDSRMKTNLAGVYAAGDITVKHLRQIVTACSDGALAASSAGSRCQK